MIATAPCAFAAPTLEVKAGNVYDLHQKKASYLLPAQDMLVLSSCAGKDHRDQLVVQQHRYFIIGGSYDWFWLYDRAGKKELGPVGEYDGVPAVQTALEEMGFCRP